MLFKTGLLLKIISVLLLFAAVSADAQVSEKFNLQMNFDGDAVIAAVDTINIKAEEFYLSFEYGPAFIRRAGNARERHLNYLINEKLLALDGYSRSIDTTEEVFSMINEFRNDIATEELFKDTILSQIKLNDSDIEEIIKKKLTVIEIIWLYTGNETGIKNLFRQVKNGVSFDSLYLTQFNDSVAVEDRSLATNIYLLENKNPQLYRIIDSLIIGYISPPVHADDGWYLVKIKNLEQNIITTDSEYLRLKQEAVNALTKKQMDQISDQFVNELMYNSKPVIKRDAFKIVRSYIGKYYLPESKYREWKLSEKLNEETTNLEVDINNKVLVTLSTDVLTIKDFLSWYRNRSLYIKLNQDSFAGFSESLEKLIWRMVRDELLSEMAADLGYNSSDEVQKQLSWWKDKITGSAVRNEILNSIHLGENEVDVSKEENNGRDLTELQQVFQKKLLHKILALKQKYNISIYTDKLNAVPLSEEYNPDAIEFYSVKNKGLIPRTPYPTINQEWTNWE
jgi:hypothetical protein